MPRAWSVSRMPTVVCVLLVLGGFALSLPSCSRTPKWTAREWSAHSGGLIPEPPSLNEQRQHSKLAGQEITYTTQSVAGVPVDDSYIKTLSRDGETLWVKTQYQESKRLPSLTFVQKELARKDRVLERMGKLQGRLGCKFTGEALPHLQWKGSWMLVFSRACESRGGEVYEIVLNSRGRLLSHEPAGAQFTLALETVSLYPKGPKLSTLKPVRMTVATTPNFLTSPSVEVISDAGYTFQQLGQISQVTPSEDRFDTLQAYYFSSEALKWFNDQFKFQLTGLRLRTQVGYPDKSNIAFYFNREIRIGTGDGVTYSRMALDPSIVIHETMHGVIEPLTHLPFRGEGGSLQEGLADTLTALYLDEPNIGETAYKAAPFQRTLANNMTVADKNGGLYHDSLILSGLLWEIKERVDLQTAQQAVSFLLAHLAPSSQFDDVKTQLRAWLTQIPNQDQAAKVEAIASRRGWL